MPAIAGKIGVRSENACSSLQSTMRRKGFKSKQRRRNAASSHLKPPHTTLPSTLPFSKTSNSPRLPSNMIRSATTSQRRGQWRREDAPDRQIPVARPRNAREIAENAIHVVPGHAILGDCCGLLEEIGLRHCTLLQRPFSHRLRPARQQLAAADPLHDLRGLVALDARLRAFLISNPLSVGFHPSLRHPG